MVNLEMMPKVLSAKVQEASRKNHSLRMIPQFMNFTDSAQSTLKLHVGSNVGRNPEQ
jgi:hypothetical protein